MNIYVSLQLNGSLSYVYSLRPAAGLNHCNYKREPAIENYKFSCMVAWPGLSACTDHLHAEVGAEIGIGYDARAPGAVYSNDVRICAFFFLLLTWISYSASACNFASPKLLLWWYCRQICEPFGSGKPSICSRYYSRDILPRLSCSRA